MPRGEEEGPEEGFDLDLQMELYEFIDDLREA